MCIVSSIYLIYAIYLWKSRRNSGKNPLAGIGKAFSVRVKLFCPSCKIKCDLLAEPKCNCVYVTTFEQFEHIQCQDSHHNIFNSLISFCRFCFCVSLDLFACLVNTWLAIARAQNSTLLDMEKLKSFRFKSTATMIQSMTVVNSSLQNLPLASFCS